MDDWRILVVFARIIVTVLSRAFLEDVVVAKGITHVSSNAKDQYPRLSNAETIMMCFVDITSGVQAGLKLGILYEQPSGFICSALL